MSFKLKAKIGKYLDSNTFDSKKGVGMTVKFYAEEVGSEYPQKGVFEFTKFGEYIKYAEQLENDFPIGTIADIEFNLQASPYKESYFGKLSVWRMDKLGEGSTEQIPVGGNDDSPFS